MFIRGFSKEVSVKTDLKWMTKAFKHVEENNLREKNKCKYIAFRKQRGSIGRWGLRDR